MTQTLTSLWTDQAPHEIALDALQRYRWSVIPVDSDKLPPKTGGFHPDGNPKRLAWKKYQTELPTKGLLLNWQRKYVPDAWAIITGELSGVVVLDYDGGPGRELIERYSFHPHVQTGSGGFHQYFRHPGWPVQTLNSKSKIDLGKKWPGLDIRGDGGYAVFYGINTKGRYIWLRKPILDDLSLLPDEIRLDLGLLYHPGSAEAKAYKSQEQTRNTINTLLDRAIDRANRGHGRDNSCYWLAQQMNDHGFTEDQTLSIMADYVARIPLYNTKGEQEDFTLDHASDKVKSAYRLPSRGPWTIHTQERSQSAPAPAPQTSTSGDGAGITHITTNGLGELPDASIELVLNCLAQAEWGDSLLFAYLFTGKTVYDHNEKEWYIWHKHHWKRDDTGRIKFYVSGKLASVYINTSAKLNEQLAALENLKSDDDLTKAKIAKLKKQVSTLYQRAIDA